MTKFIFFAVVTLIAISSCTKTNKSSRMIEVQGYIANMEDSTIYANTSFVFYNMYTKRALSTKQSEDNVIPFTTDSNGYFKAEIPLIDNSELRICWPDATSPVSRFLYQFNSNDLTANEINIETIFVQ